jgi:hypothetical protein
MDGLGGASSKPLTAPPKTRICYICGRQYGLHSYEIHLKQCKDLWIAREAHKSDPRERKKLPEDPALRLQGGGAGGSAEGEVSAAKAVSAPSGAGAPSLDELNKLASAAFNTEALDTCAYCGRTFLPEKLITHNKSCTADKPARRVDHPVRRGTEQPKISFAPSPVRPKTTQSIRPAADNIEGREDEITSFSPIAGHMGGAAGRGLRKANAAAKVITTPKDTREAKKSINSKEETVEYLSKRVDDMESIVEELVKVITEVKETIATLARIP